MPVTTVTRLGFLSSLPLLALAGLLAMGCEESDPATDAGSDAGPALTPDGGADGAVLACPTEGAGAVTITVAGLPAGVVPKIKLTGPSATPLDVPATTTIADAGAGTYVVTAERVANVHPIVRTVYAPTVSVASFCLGATQTQAVTVTYAEVATSDKLWAANANNPSGDLLGFASADLGATGSPAAKIAATAEPKAVAFDKDGNLWTLGADAPLARFAAADLGTSGTKTPDRRVVPVLTGCSPSLSALAFAPSGALWAADLCADRLIRVSADTLSASRDYTLAADDIATGMIHGPRGMAFDAAGNMWVADATSIHLYPAASLAPGQPHVPTFKVDSKNAAGGEIPPDALAFDKDGNLWATSFGGNLIFKLTPADLAPAGASKDVVPSIQVTVPVEALVESLAFDEGGGLWFTHSLGKIARLAPSQLGTSTGMGDPTVPTTIVTSANLGSAGKMAFFPAAASLPLYSRFQ